MIRNNKWKHIISSVVILLPVLAGLILWENLPEQMTSHWGADGNADGMSGPAFAVFGPPLIFLAAHWLCIFFAGKDPKNQDQTPKALGMIFWICPVISLFASGLVYAASFGKDLSIETAVFLLMGLCFVLVGNYLPKCKQNFTLGIRVKWTLLSEENWNATHRFGGKVWVIGGVLTMLCAFLPKAPILWIILIAIVTLAIIPMIYSYAYYKKQGKAGSLPEKPVITDAFHKFFLKGGIVSVAILAAVVFLLFTGSIKIRYDDTSFTINASYWSDLTVEYAEIDSLDYRGSCSAGYRANGFGSPKLSMGLFQNDEFGKYTRYAYTKCKSCVVLNVDGKILVLSGPDDESTKSIYNELAKRL